VALSDMFLAGTETTSNVTQWLLLHLSSSPEIQSKVYEEIVRVVGKEGEVALADEAE